jgi:hypothetical protein
MDERLTEIFLREIQIQCEIVELAAVFLEHAIEHGPTPGGDPTTIIWMPLQTILGAASNISKLCWGSGRKKERAEVAARRAPLREQLGLTDASPLSPGHVQNAFERLDRRLDARSDADVDADIESQARQFDETTWVAEFLGDSISIRELGVETSRVLEQSRALLALADGG